MKAVKIILALSLGLTTSCTLKMKEDVISQSLNKAKVFLGGDAQVSENGAVENSDNTTSDVRAVHASIVARQIFYNRTKSTVFGDGTGNPENAIDTTKEALLPNKDASNANYTNYFKGINGILVDIADSTGTITSSDFAFAIGDGQVASGFTTLSAPATVTELGDVGLNGSKRIKIEFADNAVQNTWLQVKIKANSNTGLLDEDVFYFGNAIGDMYTGNIGTPFVVRVNGTDTAAVRSIKNQSPRPDSVGISNIYDLNKDGRVNAEDTALVRQNQKTSILAYFTAPSDLIIDACGVVNGDGTSCLVVNGKPNITNCTSHAGRAYPWEGSGACTGNYMVSIPVGATGQVLIQNSVAPTGDFGFGNSGFRLGVDKRLYKTANAIQTVSGDGSVVTYHASGSTWEADFKQLSKNTISAAGANFEEKVRNGNKITYAPIASQSGAYGMISIVLLNGKSVNIERDAGGHIKSIKNNFNVGVTIDYDGSGHATILKDADGNEYGIIYDNERLSQVSYPDGFSTWEVGYASATNRVVSLKNTETGINKINYTSQGLVSDITEPDGKVVKFVYSSGQVQVRGFKSNVFESINSNGTVSRRFKDKLPTDFTYDNLFQVLTSTDNFGRSTKYSYNGQELASITLPNGNVQSYTYENGNIVSSTITGPLSSQTVKYAFDSNNRVISISGPGSYSRNLTYNDKGNLTEDQVNGKVVMSASYDSQGQLTSKTTKGITSNYGYDSYGNQNLLASPTGSVNYVRKPSGLTENITAPNYAESRQYDSVGRPTVVTQSSPGSGKPAYTSTTQYSLNSQLTLDNIGNGLDQQSNGDGSYKERILGEGFVNVPWGNGFDRYAPKYTNP